MAAELLLTTPRRRESPDGLHLLATVLMSHLVVVEPVSVAASPGGFACPENYFGGVGECTAAQVGGWIRLFPDYVVEQAEAVSL